VHNQVMQQAGGSIWFTDTTDVSRIFDSRLTYNKGGAFIHTLRYEINNDSLFFAFLRNYQQQFGYSTASTLDFKALLEQQTGRDFYTNIRSVVLRTGFSKLHRKVEPVYRYFVYFFPPNHKLARYHSFVHHFTGNYGKKNRRRYIDSCGSGSIIIYV
jgi:hypothetical protein